MYVRSLSINGLADLPSFRAEDLGRQVTWLYLASGAVILVVMGVHGSLGAWLASEFGVHITADQLLAAGANVQEVLP